MATLLLALFACSALDATGSDAGAELEDTGAPAPGTLRVDVRPVADALELLPQSFVLAPQTYVDVTVSHELEPTAHIQGTLTAAVFQGWTSLAASTTGPLDAVVVASHGALLQGGVTQTDESGYLSLGVPANQAYALEILPNVATASPFVFLPSQPVAQPDSPSGGLDLTQLLDAGAPVYGRVTDASGARVARTPLHIRRTDVDVQSATFLTDDQGWYVARVAPGYSYVVETEGVVRSDAAIPTVSAEFTLEAGDTDGAEVNLDVGDRATRTVKLEVLDPEGNGLLHPHVRAVSQAIAVGSLTTEVGGQTDGQVTINLVPGTWTLEVWPSADADDNKPEDNTGLTPWRETLVLPGGTDGDYPAGAITLDAPTQLSGQVLGAGGSPAAGATISVTEVGFGGFTFTAVTDADGRYTLAVPRMPLELEVLPSAAGDGAFFHASIDLSGAEADTTQDITLVAGTELKGEARSAGQPVPFALVEVYDYAREVLLARTLTDESGNYTVRIDLPETDDGDGGGTSDTGGEDTGGADTGAP